MRGFGPLLATSLTIAALAAAGCGDDAKAPADTAAGDTAVAPEDTASPEGDTAGPGDDTAPGPDTAGPGDDTAPGPDTAGPGEDTAGSDVATCGVACPEGEVRCGGAASVETCVADANGCTAWSAPVACPGAQVCQAGACVAACTAADNRCLGEAAQQRCEGGQLVESGCAFGCDAVTGACRPCPPGAWRCHTAGGMTTLEVCQSGGTWSSTGPCIACACAAGTPVTMQCTGKNPMTTSCAACGDDGQICVP